MSHLSLRRLSYFTALADVGHFGRAAKLLHISQPALSAEIRRLERELGVELFVRSSRGTHLTPAGDRFARRARALLESAGRLQEEARAVAAGTLGTVAVGFVQTMVHRGLPRAVHRLRETHPGLRVELVEMTTADQLAAIERGELDLACTHAPAAGRPSTRLRSERFLACLPVGRPSDAPLPLAALAEDDFVVFRQEVSPHYYERLLALCTAAGFRPRVVHRTSTWQSVLALVAAGLGVSLVPEGVRVSATLGTRFVDLAEPGPGSDVWLVGSTSGLPAVEIVERALIAAFSETGPITARAPDRRRC